MTYLELISEIVGQKINITHVSLIHGFQGKAQQGRFTLSTDDKVPIAYFSLVTLPGCCGILVSTGCFVCLHFRNHGLGTLLNKMRIQIAYEWGYSLLLCTDKDVNAFQKQILTKNKWSLCTSFINNRTDNMINLHTLKVKQTGIALGFQLP